MELALVNGFKREPFAGGRGNCEMCGSAMVSKCGPRVMHHWAHFGRRNCDPWWENETQWHRAWKSQFPVECREVVHVADDGEIHRADIKTPTGIVIEVQHSAMTDAERLSREAFYQNMVWVIDGTPFKQNFDFYHCLPDPKSEVAQDLLWFKAKRHMHGSNSGIFMRMSEVKEHDPDVERTTWKGGGEMHFLVHGYPEIRSAYCGHQQYDWVRPRSTWLDATCPVYIDFGEDWLARLQTYDETGLLCIFRVTKRKFIHDVMTEVSAADIATRFYPLPKNGWCDE